MDNQPVSMEECLRDRKEMQEVVKTLNEVTMPGLRANLKWNFVGFWLFLCLFFLTGRNWLTATGAAIWGFLVVYSIFCLCDCKYCIAKTKETIAYIEGIIKEKEQR